MSIVNTRQMQRRPTHPGEMLREDFLPDYGLTATALASAALICTASDPCSIVLPSPPKS